MVILSYQSIFSMIQPEQESMSEISNMETSTISGYREGFGGFDMSLQELERLEMQASSVSCIAKVCGNMLYNGIVIFIHLTHRGFARDVIVWHIRRLYHLERSLFNKYKRLWFLSSVFFHIRGHYYYCCAVSCRN